MYKEFYGFSANPFEVTPDPEFLYLTHSHVKALAAMISGVKEGKRFILITGEVGTGKTTLINSLLGRLDEKVKTAFIFHTIVTFEELLKNILQEIDLPVGTESKRDLWNQLIQCLAQFSIRDEALVIIIDEAQNLSAEVIKELLQRVTDLPSRQIQIILAGQLELEKKFTTEELRRFEQNIEIRSRISALNKDESKKYIDHRLKLAGNSASELFTSEALSMICRTAQGIPRIINILCDNAFLTGYALSKKRIDADIIREVIKDMKIPIPRKVIAGRMLRAVKEFHWVPFGLNSLQRRVSFVLLLLFCLGGLIFLIHGSLQRRTTNTWNIESIKNVRVDTEESLISPSSQTGTEKGGEADNEPGKLEQRSLQPPQRVPPPSTSLATKSWGDLYEEVISVEKGQTISSLAEKYYHMSNPTLVDLILTFNPEISNAHLIIVNQTIRIPKITEEHLIVQSPDLTYKIYIGTFGSPNFARLYRGEPVLQGREIEIVPRAISPGETWYRVMVGKFDNADEVLKMIDLLRKRGLLPLFGGSPKSG
jgi:general secretion pathway protein A